jgi:ABC-type nitrate/sulfonate/bicarbonate transport system permease component
MRQRAEAVALPLAGVALVVAFFEVAPRIGVLPRASFPPASEIVRTLGELLTTRELWAAVGDTMQAWARAMVIATLLAIPLGFAIGASRNAALLSRLTIEFLRPIPSVALIPVLILVFGPGQSLTVTLGAFGATFPLLFQAMYAIGDVDPVAADTGRAFRMSWFVRVRRIILPGCAPYLATGMRISASVALILVITGELVAGVPGLGREVLLAQNSGAYHRMYAITLLAGLLGLAVNLAFHAAERRILFWHPSQRRSEVTP